MSATVPDFYAKIGETFSPRATLTGATGIAQDLTTATSVKMSLRLKGDAATIIYNNVTCTFVASPAGTVSYDSPAPLSCTPGLYEMDFDVTFPGGIVHSFPNGGPTKGDEFLYVKISEQAA